MEKQKNTKVILISVITVMVIAAVSLIVIRQNKTSGFVDTTSVVAPAITQNNSEEINIKTNVAARVTISSLENSFIETKDLPVSENLVEGKYSITVFASEYLNYEQNLIVEKGHPVTLDVVLEKADGDILEGAPI